VWDLAILSVRSKTKGKVSVKAASRKTLIQYADACERGAPHRSHAHAYRDSGNERFSAYIIRNSLTFHSIV
jgi:hypothetical protein